MDRAVAETGLKTIAVSDARAVNRANVRTLYKAREPVYPKRVRGLFRRVKWLMMGFALAVYYLLPWMRWDRGEGRPSQAVLVDFPGERFYFFWIEIWPQEVYYITGLLILAALALFLVTSMFGRVWCGYACPQTVWTDLFMAVERFFEGDRNAQIRLAKSPWSAAKVLRKTAKHIVWLLIAAATGGALVFYFHDAPSLLPAFFDGTASGSAYLFMGILTFTTYSLAGFAREQVCIYMCPWPRIQAALIDEHALNVTYRRNRGEPRGSHKKGQSWDGRGHCIDCNQCVAACPMGIDIRDGDQLECINCALCIDACNDVMKKVGLPTGLIGYDTTRNVELRVRGEKPKITILRPRTFLYLGLIAAIGGVMLFSLGTRATIDLNVLRDRNPPYVRLSDGSFRNAYTLKLMNRTGSARDFVVSVSPSDVYALRAVGEESGGTLTVRVAADETRALRIFLTAPAQAEESVPVSFSVTDPLTGEFVIDETNFLTGGR